MKGSVTTPKFSVEIVYHGPWRILSQWHDCGVNSVGQGPESEKENGKAARLRVIYSIFSHHCTLNRLFQSIKMYLVLYWPYIFKKYLNLFGKKIWASFESLAGQHVFVGELPVKMEERGSQQTGCSLLSRLTLSGPPLRPWSRWSLFSTVPLLPPPRFALAITCPQTCLASTSSFPEPPELPSTNHKSPQPWAHWCEPMSNTCFWSVAVHANHNTHFIWSLSSSQSQHTRGTGCKKYGFYRWERPFQRMTFLSTNVTANAPCIIASLENGSLE